MSRPETSRAVCFEEELLFFLLFALSSNSRNRSSADFTRRLISAMLGSGRSTLFETMELLRCEFPAGLPGAFWPRILLDVVGMSPWE